MWIFCNCVLCKNTPQKQQSTNVFVLCDEVITSKMCFSLAALPAHRVEASSRLHLSADLSASHLDLLLLLSRSCSSCFPLSTDIDMKKDIETLIAEERADIILKYATVSLCFQHTEHPQCFVVLLFVCLFVWSRWIGQKLLMSYIQLQEL